MLKYRSNAAEVANKIEKLATSLQDLSEFFKKVAVPQTQDDFNQLWNTQGFGSWQSDLYQTGALRKSFTDRRTRNNISNITEQTFEYGSDLFYAGYYEDEIIGTVANKIRTEKKIQQKFFKYILKKSKIAM